MNNVDVAQTFLATFGMSANGLLQPLQVTTVAICRQVPFHVKCFFNFSFDAYLHPQNSQMCGTRKPSHHCS